MTTSLSIEDIVYILVQKRLSEETFDAGNFKAINNKIHFHSTFYGVDSNLITGRRVSNTSDIDIDGIIVDKGEYRMIKLIHSFGFDQKVIFYTISVLLLVAWLIYAYGIHMRQEDASNLALPCVIFFTGIFITWICMRLFLASIADRSKDFYLDVLDAKTYRLSFSEEFKKSKDPIN